MNILARIFGKKPQINFKDIQKQGAILIDVRNPSEFAVGHIKDSFNIPLDNLKNEASKLSKQTPIILCCASGMRSGSAQAYLTKQGYKAYNGGGWKALKNKLE